MAELPTIAVVDASAPGGFIVINESDFNPDEHKPYKGKVPTAPLEGEAVIETPIPTVQPSDRLDEMTLTQLRGLAQAEDVKGRSSMSQEELIAALAEKGYTR
jgi:hypothetical protein